MGYYAVGDTGYYARGGFFSGIGNFLGRAIQRVTPIAAALPGTAGAVGRALTPVVGAVSRHPIVSSAAGALAAGAVTSYIGRSNQRPPGGMQIPGTPGASGMAIHPTLHMHFSRKRGMMVKGRRRRMNYCNVRALRRAIRRAHGFEHIARSVISFPFHKHKAKRGVFKRKASGRSRAAT